MTYQSLHVAGLRHHLSSEHVVCIQQLLYVSTSEAVLGRYTTKHSNNQLQDNHWQRAEDFSPVHYDYSIATVANGSTQTSSSSRDMSFPLKDNRFAIHTASPAVTGLTDSPGLDYQLHCTHLFILLQAVCRAYTVDNYTYTLCHFPLPKMELALAVTTSSP